MRIRDRLALALAEYLGSVVFRVLYSTLRFEVGGRAFQAETWGGGQPVVFVTWHGRLLPLLYLYRDKNLTMLVSRHRDGEYLTRVGRRLGYDAVRGSSTRGGYQALRELVRHLRRGRSLAITPDGPLGPKEEFKPGALQAARMAGAPLIPVMAGADRAWWIEGWDRFMVPKPFAHVRVEIGEPCRVSRDVSGAELERVAREMEGRLNRMKERVDTAVTPATVRG